MQDQEFNRFLQERQKRQDEYWTGPRFMGLLFAFLIVALSAIYTTASLKSGDFRWNGGHPLAHEPAHEAEISDW